ncbi:MAG: UDP-N-acetylglucosamine--undecaprenyl-phosphate N-acetylglucosaminephosphotransferase, partial [Haemophilus parainfluenzae]|nr:UDP-N-acetylglucosamine--undecaprenyl-phosphate N-acetylglucosaminephosphotransferase [Haemophilus parainfluenzae]
MLSLIVTFLGAFLTLLVMRPIANKIGLVDKPNYRKRHQGAIPLIGGVSLFMGNLCYYLMEWDQLRLPYLYIFSIFVLLAIGILDDRFDISPFLRAGIQAVLAILMIDFTVFATIAIINAFNMIDGIDGLLGGLSIVSFAAIGILMFRDGQMDMAYWSFGLIVAILPYLLLNLGIPFGPKYKVFMGDAGSTLIGFTIIWILLLSTQGKGHPMNPVTALWIIAVPLIDMVAIIYRRLRKGKSPFRPDRLHVHHLMVRAGLTSRQAFLLITFFAAICATIGILGEVFYINEWAMFIAFIVLFFLYAYSITKAWK